VCAGVLSLPHIGVVDVRDVAAAHILALEQAGAAGQRLLCASCVLHFSELVATLRRLFPQYPVGAQPAPAPAPPASWANDTKPLATLGHAHYVDVEPMLRDTVLSLIQHKVVPQL
jgi:nucleoside-diphosphate-sugar epimerase